MIGFPGMMPQISAEARQPRLCKGKTPVPLKTLLALLLCCTLLTACKSKEQQAEEFYQSGMALLQSGDEARATVQFRNAVRALPTHIEAQLALARINLRDGDLRPAYRGFLRVSEQDPSNLEAQVALAQIGFLTQNWDAFQTAAKAAIALAPDDPQVKVIDLADRYRQAVTSRDEPTRAALLTEAETLETQVPDSDVLRRILIDGYLNAQKYDAALTQIDKAIAASPNEPEFYKVKIQVLAKLQDKAGLEATLRKVVEVFPDDTSAQSNLLGFLIGEGRTDDAEAFMRERVAKAAPGDAAPMVDLIQFLLQVRDRPTAMAELDKAIAADPESYTLRALHASLTYDAGQRDAGITEMQAILDTPDSGIPEDQLQGMKVTLATMLSRNGNEVGARSLVEEILKQDPHANGALKMRARWLISDDNTDGAIAAMRTALADSPKDAEAMTIMAEAYQRSGNHDLMLDFLSQAVEASGNAPAESLRYASALIADNKLPQAESILVSALRLQPRNVDILTQLGQIYLQQNDTPRAKQVIDALRATGDAGARNSADMFNLQLLAKGEGADQALQYLQNLANSGNGNDDAKLTLIRAKLQAGQTDEALAYVNQLVADNPDNTSYLFFRGLTLAAVGKFDEAAADLEQVVAKVPKATQAWTQLARLETRKQDPKAVLDTLERGLAANPGAGDLLWAKASYLQEQGDIDGAIKIYEDLYNQNSGSLVVANNLASLLTTYRSDPESLQKATLIARRMQGTDVPVLQDTYGWILFLNGDAEQALTYLEPAAKALTEDASVQYHLGMVYDALGRPEQALDQFRIAMTKVGPMGTGALKDQIQAKIDTLGAAKN